MGFQPEISAKTTDTPTSIFEVIEGRVPLRVTFASGQTITKGMAVAEISASHKYGEYDNSGGGGLEVCKGIAADDYDASAGDEIGYIWIHGTMIAANLTGVDANAVTDLGIKKFLNDTIYSF